MATPVVTVSFTADVQCDVSPLTVQFTDTTNITDGFARVWLWDFGDGSISTEQNPSHIFSGSPGETFDVRLTVLATEGEFDALSTVVINAARVSNDRLTGSDSTPALAWAARVNDPLDDVAIYHTLNWNGVTYFYFTNNVTMTFNSNVNESSFILAEMIILTSYGITTIDGFVDVLGIQTTPTVINSWEVHSRLLDVTLSNPLTTEVQVLPEVELAASGFRRGIKAKLRTKRYNNSATQVFNDLLETAFISLATSPVADFTAAPTAGPNPLSVQFTNTTIQSDCGPTATYSWKKRITGSGDAFVEFSTAENPLASFGKS